MTDTSVAHDQGAKRYPLSFTQEWFLSMDKGDETGPFGRRYLIVIGLGVTGPVDLAVLQGALDDVVARHELLRTLVKRGATVLMVSHDLEQVRRIADRVTVLDRSVITEGPAVETLAQERVAALLPSGRQGQRRR